MELSPYLTEKEVVCPCGCGFGLRLGDLDPEALYLFLAIRSHQRTAIKVTSACRCFDYQMELKKTNENAVLHSPHCAGLALDLLPPRNVPLVEFYERCCYVTDIITGGRGGVGIYRPQAGNFVHVDTGRGYRPGRRWSKP